MRHTRIGIIKSEKHKQFVKKLPSITPTVDRRCRSPYTIIHQIRWGVLFDFKFKGIFRHGYDHSLSLVQKLIAHLSAYHDIHMRFKRVIWTTIDSRTMKQVCQNFTFDWRKMPLSQTLLKAIKVMPDIWSDDFWGLVGRDNILPDRKSHF